MPSYPLVPLAPIYQKPCLSPIIMIRKKFCDGIARWSKNETASGETRELIKDLILKWHEAGCSQDKEDHAWKVIQKNDTLVVEYITTWKGKLLQ